jgi:hypothetical protein
MNKPLYESNTLATQEISFLFSLNRKKILRLKAGKKPLRYDNIGPIFGES